MESFTYFLLLSTSGKGDTEIGLIIRDRLFCSHFVKELLSEHAGQSVPDDRSINWFMLNTFDTTAVLNGNHFHNVFNIFSFTDTKAFVASQLRGEDRNNELASVKGHVVKRQDNWMLNDTQSTKLSRFSLIRPIAK